MSISALPPTAPTTLVILLGASAWPNSPGFEASKAFVHAAHGFRDYLLDSQGFGLPEANLLDLFDAPSNAADQLEQLGSFLEQRSQAQKAVNQAVRDVLVYFVGHGGFAGPSADFYLMPHRANVRTLRASGMAIEALAEVLREKARQMRRYLFLDCCFAAAAFRAFLGGPDQTAITKTLDAFAVRARSSGFPRKGTVLLCSSDQKSPALLLPDESCTMFSYALLDVLRNGDIHRSHPMSLRDLKELAEDRLAALQEKNAPRPGLYSPDQSEGDVADVPFFPNPRTEEAERTRRMEEERQRGVEEERARKAQEGEAARKAEPKPPIVPPPYTPRLPKYGVSRRTVVMGLGLAGLVVAGGGIAWFEIFHPPPPPAGTPTPSPATPMPTSTSRPPPRGTLLYTYRRHSSYVFAVAWSPDGKRIASGSNDKTVQVWDSANGGHVFIYRGHSKAPQYGVFTVAWSPDGKRIASGSDDRTVQVWDAADGGNIYTYHGHSSYVLAVAWSPDGKRIASGSGIITSPSSDHTVQVWDASSGHTLLTYTGHTAEVLSVVWSPNGERIASGSQDRTVQVWDTANGGSVYTYRGHSNNVNAVAWSPDGKRIASGSDDQTVQVWDASTGAKLFTYTDHTGNVDAVVWSPDGTRIASGSADGTVQVWDAADGGHVYIYRGHSEFVPESVNAVAWSPDGKRIASGSADQTVQVWVAG